MSRIEFLAELDDEQEFFIPIQPIFRLKGVGARPITYTFHYVFSKNPTIIKGGR